jgi:dUTP pyrophosphatase
MTQPTIKFKTTSATAPELPSFATPLAAGMDLRADLGGSVTGLTLRYGDRRLVKCGFSMELPPGYEAQVRSRSGLALKHGIVVLNSPGTIDADYRGEVGVILVNWGNEAITIEHGDRIAQMVIAKHEQPAILVVNDLSGTERGAGGFGSTGAK